MPHVVYQQGRRRLERFPEPHPDDRMGLGQFDSAKRNRTPEHSIARNSRSSCLCPAPGASQWFKFLLEFRFV